MAEGGRLLVGGGEGDPGLARERRAERTVAAVSEPACPRVLGPRVHDLVDALVREAELLGDLAHRSALRMQAADHVLVVHARDVDLVLQVEQPLADRLGFAQKLVIECHHASSVLDRSLSCLLR